MKLINKLKSIVTLNHKDKNINLSDEYAQVIEWQPIWDTGTPMPHVYSNGTKTFLTYLVGHSNQNSNEEIINQIDSRNKTIYQWALVEFLQPNTHRFGTANDKVAVGHPLYNKGLEFYSAHIIVNSGWMLDLMKIHKYHPYFNKKKWTNKKHFLLFFHDEIFEIIAEDYKTETYVTTFSDLSTKVIEKLSFE